MVYKQDEEAYDAVVEDGLDTFQELVALYLAGTITLAVLRQRYRTALRAHYGRLMLAALGPEVTPTEEQLAELERRVTAQEVLMEGFMSDLGAGAITPNRALWRAGMYAPDRGAFIYYTVPGSIADLMNEVAGLPGDICLGDGLCGCRLEVTFDTDGAALVTWVVDPIKEHCEVCLAMEAASPFIFSAEQVNANLS